MKEFWQDRANRLAILVGLSASFLLIGYEFLRSASNVLFQARYGTQNLSAVQALLPPCVLAFVWVYNRILTAFGPRKTLAITTLSSSAGLVLCYVMIRAGVDSFAWVLYLFREAYIILVIEQYWSLLNSELGIAGSKKWNGPIVGISSAGSIFGGVIVYSLAESIGTLQLVLLAGVVTIPAAILSDRAHRWVAHSPREAPERSELESSRHTNVGFSELKRVPVLPILATIVVLTQVVSTVLGIGFQSALQLEFHDSDRQTAFSGSFYATVNVLAAVFNFILCPWIMRSMKNAWIWVHLLIPCIHIGAALYLVLFPSMLSAGLAFLLFKSLDYSFFRATKELIYVPLSFDARYRAKELIDTFGYRFGKGATSATLYIAHRTVGLADGAYSWVSLAASCAWAGVAIPMIRLLRKQAPAEANTRR